MSSCAVCSQPLPAAALYCPACGAAANSSALATRASDTHARQTGTVGAPGSDAYAPGQTVAGRYRVIELLGRGGMGEVYRADDVRLGQVVALKFLPRALAADARFRERFHAEVRNARQVSHPYVCRVFDLGEADGRLFLTMEFVDGEDLARLLHRIGRLPDAKALEIARQVCAGLQAAHDRGVIHRDLKPANVMIDGRGRARISDFGLAVAGEAPCDGEIAGTPAYMAPEQLAGSAASVQSDIYALGLLLYEIFTGARPFSATTIPEWRRVHRDEPPVNPSTHSRTLDPVTESVILQCLEKDPAQRPRSAAQVALALPGGDPVAAALAAGETPSPEMVAATPERGALSSRAIGALVAGIVLAVGVVPFLGPVALIDHFPAELSPEVLADRAHTIAVELGAPARPGGQAHGFVMDLTYAASDSDPLTGPARWRRFNAGQPAVIGFWYRQGAAPFRPRATWPRAALVTPDDPPDAAEGATLVLLDLRGRLVAFSRVPASVTADDAGSGRAAADIDWDPLFRAAGLSRAQFVPATPRWTPPVYADARVAWTGAFADHPELPLRVEAAAAAGRPVFFRAAGAWDIPPATAPDPPAVSAIAGGVIIAVVAAIALVGALFLARRNLALGRGDRNGARRLALAGMATSLAATAIGAHAGFTPEALRDGFVLGLRQGLATGALLWLAYIALEPAVRVNRPRLIVSWARLLGGNVADPMVGRDVLIGVFAGAAAALAWSVAGAAKIWTGSRFAPNFYLDPLTLTDARTVAAFVIDRLLAAVVPAFVALLFIAAMRRFLRTERAAGFVLWILAASVLVLFGNRSVPAIAATLATTGLLVVVVTRFGLVSGIAANFVLGVVGWGPVTFDPSRFYFGGSLAILAVVAALMAFGAWSARGARTRGVSAAR